MRNNIILATIVFTIIAIWTLSSAFISPFFQQEWFYGVNWLRKPIIILAETAFVMFSSWTLLRSISRVPRFWFSFLLTTIAFYIFVNIEVHQAYPTPSKKAVVPVTPSLPTPSGWKTLMVDDGFTWYTPEDPTKTTEWFSIEDINFKSRLKEPAIMEFKKVDGTVVTFKATEEGNFLEMSSGFFSGQKWSDEAYIETAHKSVAVRFKPIGDSELRLRVGQRSY